MTTTLIVADEVSLLARDMRRDALSLTYSTVKYGGTDFPGVNLDGLFQKRLMNELCPVIAGLVGFAIRPHLSFMRLTVASHEQSVYIHADSQAEGSWAAIYYLTEPDDCVGGTAFWTHKATGMSQLPLEQFGSHFDTMMEDGKNEGLWTMNGLVEMRFNRLAIYPGNLFHSRYPSRFPNADDKSGRLTWVCFFDPATHDPRTNN